ncbi:WbuC family cupin fold metalloprotein [Shewanella glacialipiscicola]|uniref:WbuC family cupin fold metalloprotein n=1 Tax=Shewanella glacialipiscicola TaxID=614069 RepID=UPI003D7A74E7
MRIFGTTQFDYLFQDAALSPRKRTHLNLHSSFDDKVQRLYIAMLKGSYVEPHYHNLPHQWEMFFVLQGVIHLKLFNADGSLKESVLIGEGHDVLSMELQPNDIHSVECISDRVLMLEIKEGPFKPECAKVFPNW